MRHHQDGRLVRLGRQEDIEALRRIGAVGDIRLSVTPGGVLAVAAAPKTSQGRAKAEQNFQHDRLAGNGTDR